MKNRILLITPPFTQLNTPYPATAYIKGFLNTLAYDSRQADLGIEVILKLFSSKGLRKIFDYLDDSDMEISDQGFRVYSLKNEYLKTIDPVISFLQNKNQTLAHAICDRSYLPEAGRFAQLDDLEWAFGTMGTHDKARHLATLYLEDLGDLIKETIDPHFGFSRYAERLARTASDFDEMLESLEEEETIITDMLIEALDEHLNEFKPSVVCITAPFPGNVFGAFKCGQYIKTQYPDTRIIFGGGYANTELRRISDERVFDFIDYITLDDGEAPLQQLLEHLEGLREKTELKRTFTLSGGVVCYINNSKDKDIPQREVGTPDYSDLKLNDYLSVIELVNPMHRLWSDGRWNKLTLAHGCYWGKCTFCDVSLDYISRYEPVNAALLCDRIEEIISQTGQNGFHFVDEAAPPALMRDLAIEIIRRGLTVIWWTNIRFEKSFTPDLCRLLKASGCIAISGGLEVASDRLLDKMKKGVTVAQVARVADAFTQSGIMVHAYLMYGFPTQTAQETVDSLEMVRQLFQNGILQSGFWHQFAMTAHSPVGISPESYGVHSVGPKFGGFAENDLFHEDPEGAEHELFSEGLKVSLFNYMHGAGLEEHHSHWFDFDIPETSIPEDYIENSLNEEANPPYRNSDIVIWLGGSITESSAVELEYKRGKYKEQTQLVFTNKKKEWSLYTEENIAGWISELIERAAPGNEGIPVFEEVKKSFPSPLTFETFLESETWALLRENGLLVV